MHKKKRYTFKNSGRQHLISWLSPCPTPMPIQCTVCVWVCGQISWAIFLFDCQRSHTTLTIIFLCWHIIISLYFLWSQTINLTLQRTWCAPPPSSTIRVKLAAGFLFMAPKWIKKNTKPQPIFYFFQNKISKNSKKSFE